MNLCAQEFLKIPNATALSGRPLATADFFRPSSPAVQAMLRDLKKANTPAIYEGLQVLIGKGTIKDVLVQAGRAAPSSPFSPGILLALTDISEGMSRTRRLADCESKWLSMLASAPDIILIIDKKGIVQFISRVVGGTKKQVLGRSILDFVLPQDQRAARRTIRQVFSSGRTACYEARGITPNGRVGWFGMCVGPVKRNGKTKEAIVIARDISAQRKAKEKLQVYQTRLKKLVAQRTEELLKSNIQLKREIKERKAAAARLLLFQEKLRSYSHHLEDIREKERTSLAHDIHDEMGAALTRLKMTIGLLEERHKGNPDFRILRDQLNGQIQQAMDDVRNLIARLRPPVLDEIGLPAAISWQARAFEKSLGIRCRILRVPENLKVGDAVATALFRIFQELLTNVARHAEATEVRVQLTRQSGLVILRVTDNGRGIRGNEISSVKSYGLMGIRERIIGLGGNFKICRAGRRGTRAEAVIPVEES